MNTRRYILLFTCFFVFYGMSAFAQGEYGQHEVLPPDLPEGVLEEMLSNEDLPEEIRRGIEEALRAREAAIASEVPDSDQQVKPEVATGSASNKISLDLKGVDIIDVLKMLSARSNLNIVAGRNVKGKVTLFLKDVDIWDAFEIILAANNLAYDKQRNIINVMTERDYEQLYGEKYYNKKELRVYRLEYAKVADIGKALNQAKSKIGKVVIDESSNTVVLIDSPKTISAMEDMIKKMDVPIETKVFNLNYAKAEDLKTKLSEILTKGVGTMQVDERTNKLIITDLSKKMPEISSVIKEMDEKHKEVLIEAKIIEVSLTDEYEYGVDWKAAFRSLEDQGFRISLDDFSGNVWTGATGGTLTLASVASRNINGVIEALKTVGKTNVISSPRITVLNNEEAKVLVGTNQPYISGTTTVGAGDDPVTSESITYVDVGVELTVTPTINEEGFVTMRIKPKISSVTGQLGVEGDRESIPIVSTSETETTVMVKDGTTIIIAGLIEDRDELEEKRIPILGDIPLIGPLLFGNKSVGSSSLPEKKELVIFLTPYIIHGTETFPEAENVWYGDSIAQRELLERQISLAVEDLEEKRSIVGEVSPPTPKKDTTTRLAKDLKWFSWKKEPKEVEPEEVELEEMKPEEVKTEKVKSKKAKPAKVKRGTVPEKVKTAKAERGTVPEKVKVDKKEEEKTKEVPASQPIFTPTVGGYNVYLESLRNKILWAAKDDYPESLKGRREDVMVLFTLTSDGRLKGKPKVLDEVDKRIAKAVKNAVEKAAPFPPFPKEIEKNRETFRITITYE